MREADKYPAALFMKLQVLSCSSVIFLFNKFLKSKVGLDIESTQLVEQSVKVAQRYMERLTLGKCRDDSRMLESLSKKKKDCSLMDLTSYYGCEKYEEAVTMQKEL